MNTLLIEKNTTKNQKHDLFQTRHIGPGQEEILAMLKDLGYESIDELIDNYDNIDMWREKFPPNSYLFKGFVISNIFDVSDDPRIQYPEAAIKEGISSILAVPIIIGRNLIGSLRIYTREPWEFTLNDVQFAETVAQVFGMSLELCRVNKGLKDSIDILKTMRDPKTVKSRKRTPYEGVPKSFSRKEIVETSA